ncbi:MAG: glutamate racemase [Deltaproteobacteria bacterium]|nr:glutamate racemase [Deltaproteobacteria bacterium]
MTDGAGPKVADSAIARLIERVGTDAPLGVFDSGLGGLTVVRAMRERLPNEDIIYLGDNARVPYGTRSPETIVRYALGCARELSSRGVKAIIVACNTVSAVALDRLRAELDLPVTGVIIPGARAATRASGEAPVGVLGTLGTISSGAYTRAVASFSSRTEVLGQAAPLLVALAEEGWTEGEVPRLVVRKYLDSFFGPEVVEGFGLPRASKVGCVVLGCTHFPLFRELIEREVREIGGRGIPVVDSARETASDVEAFLNERGMRSRRDEAGRLELLVTDKPRSFEAVASRFLGGAVGGVDLVDLKPE